MGATPLTLRPQEENTPRSIPRQTPTPPERFRWWVLLLGVALIPVNCLWVARTEALDYSGFPTCMSLFYNVIFTLMALLTLNMMVRRVFPRLALCRQELLVVYAMTATGSSLVGHDYMQMLVPTIPHVAYFASPENNWNSQIQPLLPSWLTIGTLNDAVRSYERGHSTLYTWEHISLWLAPIACWSIFLLAVIGATLSLSVLLRRQWVENERLSYPIVQIPLLITEGGGGNSTFRNKLLWAGFGIAAGIDLLNGLQMFFPALPMIPVKVQDISPYFPNPPWNAIGWTPVSFYPFAIGLSFFMPTNLAFSGLFFFFARKMQQVAGAALGYHDVDSWFPYLKEQAYGAWIAIILAALWFSRGYLKGVWRTATSRQSADDGGISYRLTLAVFLICVVTMAVFLLEAGMSPALGIVYVALYVLFCGAAARIRAEVGPPSHEIGWVGTSYMLVGALGTTALGPKNLALFSLLHFQNRMHRGLLMPQQAESLKAASVSGLRMRVMAGAMAIAGVVGVLSAFWALLHLGYGRTYAAAFHPGAPGSAFAAEHYRQLSSWLSTPVKPNQAGVNAMILGATLTLLLSYLSVGVYGFPFHPAGYALGTAFGLDYIWMPILISWVLKVLILRYRGLKGYRAAIPFFVGLVLGEFTVGGFWSFVRGVLGVQTYTFYIW
jgi:hypothetical protein